MKPLRGARHGARPLTAPSTAALRKLGLASQRSAENSIGTSEESSIGIDTPWMMTTEFGRPSSDAMRL